MTATAVALTATRARTATATTDGLGNWLRPTTASGTTIGIGTNTAVGLPLGTVAVGVTDFPAVDRRGIAVLSRGSSEGVHHRAVFVEVLAVQCVRFIERIVPLVGIAVQTVVRVVMQEVSKDTPAIIAVSHGVENVLVPEEVDRTVRHVHRGIGLPENDPQIPLVPLLGLDGLLFRPALAFGFGLHELSSHVLEVELFEPIKTFAEGHAVTHFVPGNVGRKRFDHNVIRFGLVEQVRADTRYDRVVRIAEKRCPTIGLTRTKIERITKHSEAPFR